MAVLVNVVSALIDDAAGTMVTRGVETILIVG